MHIDPITKGIKRERCYENYVFLTVYTQEY
jgi:hypothetical protein